MTSHTASNAPVRLWPNDSGTSRTDPTTFSLLLLDAVAVVVVSWLLMIVLAGRLPPGLAKDLATVLPACVTTARRLLMRSGYV